MVTVKITPNDKGNPPGKLADAELHFTGPSERLQAVYALRSDRPDDYVTQALKEAMDHARALEGLKLIGFAVWERRGGSGRNVTFPARQYSINGERRSFALLRPIVDATAQDRIRQLILDAFAAYEAETAGVR
ncbi:MAG TPA: hypothetical protein VEL79_02045 [Vicinamibacterales bacterium]|nr:hypothetical protein [Vicinamibacterales bacterium]